MLPRQVENTRMSVSDRREACSLTTDGWSSTGHVTIATAVANTDDNSTYMLYKNCRCYAYHIYLPLYTTTSTVTSITTTTTATSITTTATTSSTITTTTTNTGITTTITTTDNFYHFYSITCTSITRTILLQLLLLLYVLTTFTTTTITLTITTCTLTTTLTKN